MSFDYEPEQDDGGNVETNLHDDDRDGEASFRVKGGGGG